MYKYSHCFIMQYVKQKRTTKIVSLANLKLLSIWSALGPGGLVPQQDVDFLLDPVLVVWCIREGLLLVPATYNA